MDEVRGSLEEVFRGRVGEFRVRCILCEDMAWREVHQKVGVRQVATVYVPLMGELEGDVFMMMEPRAGRRVVERMLDVDIGKTLVLGEFEISAFKELGNVVMGRLVEVLSRRLGASVMLTTPNWGCDVAGALVDQVLMRYVRDGGLFVVGLHFEDDAGIDGDIWVLLKSVSLDVLSTKGEI